MSKIEPRDVHGLYRGVRKNDDGEKVYTFVASTSDPDRHRTVLNQKGWDLEDYNANPVVGYQHNLYGDMCNAPDPDDVIGKGFAYVENNELLLDTVFDSENEKAVKIQSKIDRGFLNTVSVGFREIGDGHRGNEDDGEDPNLYYFHRQELLEVSIVNIPSNPKALKKSFRSQTFDALKYVYKELGGKFRMSEIEDMKVRDILTLLDGDKVEKGNTDATHPIGEFKYKIVKSKVALIKGK